MQPTADSVSGQGAAEDGAPRLSVVVPHLNEPDDLRRCLAALEAEKAYGVPFEIVIVDNGSRQPPVAICSDAGVRLEEEPMPGPGPARNRGATVARAEIIAFLDVDCIPDRGFVSAIVRRFD